jgi:hypothetical protein
LLDGGVLDHRGFPFDGLIGLIGKLRSKSFEVSPQGFNGGELTEAKALDTL